MPDRVVVLPSEAYKAKFNEQFGDWPRDQLGDIPHNEGVSQMGWTNFVAHGITFVHESGVLHEPYPAGWELSPGVPPGDERRWREFIRQVVDDDA